MRRKSEIDWRVSCASVWISSRRSLTLSFSSCAKSFQPEAGQASDAAQPVGIELVAEILLQEIHAIDAVRFGQAQQLAFERQQPAVDAVHLIDERFDAVVVEAAGS